MSLQQNSNRIQTTHIGSLPRPHRLLDLMKANNEVPGNIEGVWDTIFAAASAAAETEVDVMGRTSKELGKDRAAGRSLDRAGSNPSRPGSSS